MEINTILKDKLLNDIMVLSKQDVQELKDLINMKKEDYEYYSIMENELINFLDWCSTSKIINPLMVESNFDTPRLLLYMRVLLPNPKDLQNKKLALKIKQLKRVCNSLYLLKLDCNELNILKKYVLSVYYLYCDNEDFIVNRIESQSTKNYYLRTTYLFECHTLRNINYYLSDYFEEQLNHRQQIPATMLRIRNKIVKVLNRVDKLVDKIMNKEGK